MPSICLSFLFWEQKIACRRDAQTVAGGEAYWRLTSQQTHTLATLLRHDKSTVPATATWEGTPYGTVESRARMGSRQGCQFQCWSEALCWKSTTRTLFWWSFRPASDACRLAENGTATGWLLIRRRLSPADTEQMRGLRRRVYLRAQAAEEPVHRLRRLCCLCEAQVDKETMHLQSTSQRSVRKTRAGPA